MEYRCASVKGSTSGNSSSGLSKREREWGKQCMVSGGRGYVHM
jgi:hypothetical protein